MSGFARVTLNAWEGKACTAFTEGANGNGGVNVLPSDASSAARLSSPGDDICDRIRLAIVAVFFAGAARIASGSGR